MGGHLVLACLHLAQLAGQFALGRRARIQRGRQGLHLQCPLFDVVGDLATLIHQLGQPLLLLGNARLVLSDLLERRFGLVHLMFEFDNLRGQPQQLMLRRADAFDLVPHIGHLNRQASEEILEYVEFGSPAQLMSAPASLGCHSPVAPLRGRCRDRKRNSTVRVLGNQGF